MYYVIDTNKRMIVSVHGNGSEAEREANAYVANAGALFGVVDLVVVKGKRQANLLTK